MQQEKRVNQHLKDAITDYCQFYIGQDVCKPDDCPACPVHEVAENVKGVLQKNDNPEKQLYQVVLTVKGFITIPVRATSIDEARDIAIDVCSEYNFGDLQNIDWEYHHTENEDEQHLD